MEEYSAWSWCAERPWRRRLLAGRGRARGPRCRAAVTPVPTALETTLKTTTATALTAALATVLATALAMALATALERGMVGDA